MSDKKLNEIFTEGMIDDARVLHTEMNNLGTSGSRAGIYKKEIVEPNILEINRKTGQVNSPLFLAYLLEYAFTEEK